jgi:hypothetical protein
MHAPDSSKRLPTPKMAGSVLRSTDVALATVAAIRRDNPNQDFSSTITVIRSLSKPLKSSRHFASAHGGLKSTCKQ